MCETSRTATATSNCCSLGEARPTFGVALGYILRKRSAARKGKEIQCTSRKLSSEKPKSLIGVL